MIIENVKVDIVTVAELDPEAKSRSHWCGRKNAKIEKLDIGEGALISYEDENGDPAYAKTKPVDEIFISKRGINVMDGVYLYTFQRRAD